jgi:hypothetical protein
MGSVTSLTIAVGMEVGAARPWAVGAFWAELVSGLVPQAAARTSKHMAVHAATFDNTTSLLNWQNFATNDPGPWLVFVHKRVAI